MKKFTINTNQGIGNQETYIFLARFTFSNYRLSQKRFVELLQDNLYDKMGSAGHFHLVPSSKLYLTPDFIEGAIPTETAKVLTQGVEHKNNNTVVNVAFILRECDAENPIDEEIKLFEDELTTLAILLRHPVTIEQVDISTFYPVQYIDYQTVANDVSDKQRTAIYEWCLAHAKHFGTLPHEYVEDGQDGDIHFDYNIMLSALTKTQLRRLDTSIHEHRTFYCKPPVARAAAS